MTKYPYNSKQENFVFWAWFSLYLLLTTSILGVFGSWYIALMVPAAAVVGGLVWVLAKIIRALARKVYPDDESNN